MTSIRTKAILYIVAPTLVVYGVMLGGTLLFLRRQSLSELETNMTRLASHYAGRFDSYLREAAAVADTAGVALAHGNRAGERAIFEQLRANVGQRSFIYGACAAYEPESSRDAGDLYAPYVYRKGDSLMEMNISRDVYDWYGDAQWTWFREPKASGRPVWSAPYFDQGAGNVLMTTYSSPFFADGRFTGVATVDINLANLQDTIGPEVSMGTGFVILARDGSFVYDRNPERILHQKLIDVAQQTANRELMQLMPRILSGNPGVAAVRGWESREKEWLFFSPIPSTGWTFVAFVPEQVALAGLRSRMVTASIALAATLLMIVAAICLVTGKIVRPLTRLTAKVDEVAAGNLNAHIEGVGGHDELSRLAGAFNTMSSRLQAHIDRLAEEEASRRKIEHDLSIARAIQQGLLPNTVPPLEGYDLAGWSQPADETGGDYYDWQPLPNGRLAISLADVTGHGIGPALVTAVCRAYARACFPGEEDVAKVLDRMNELLCADLQAERFVTFVVALVDPGAQTVRLLSAGHGPLFYYDARAQTVHQYNAHDIPMGLSPDIAHGPPSEFSMAPGDALVLITDGFFEWSNAEGEQFGGDRLAESIRAAHALPSDRLIASLVADVLRFAGGTRQLDDLTAVVLKRRPVQESLSHA